METQGIQSPFLRLQVSGSAVILLSLGAMATLMVGMPSVAAVSPAPTFAPAVSTGDAKPRYRGGCEECAVVTSIREIEPLDSGIHSGPGSKATKESGNAMTGEALRRLEITVRMRDGSTRVIDQARSANWRVNERLIVIGGASTGNESRTILPVASDAG